MIENKHYIIKILQKNVPGSNEIFHPRANKFLMS